MTPADERRIAENATKGPWAPWRDQDGTPHMNGLLMVGNADAVIPEGETWIEGVDINPIAHVLTPEDREFIATFNPERVLEMIDDLDSYRRSLRKVTDRNVELTARLAAVEEVHERREYWTETGEDICDTCSRRKQGDFVYWPCDTIKAVRGE